MDHTSTLDAARSTSFAADGTTTAGGKGIAYLRDVFYPHAVEQIVERANRRAIDAA